MNRNMKIWCTLIFFPIFLTGCIGVGKQTKPINIYALEYDPPISDHRNAIQTTIRIDRFRTSPLYETTKIVYREKPFSRATYYYHRWQSKPADVITTLLQRDMQASSLFKTVVLSHSKARTSYVVEGFIEDFYEQDDEDMWMAVVSMTINLISAKGDHRGDATLIQKRYSDKEPCKQKHPKALAEAMSSAMARISGMIINDIYDAVAAAF